MSTVKLPKGINGACVITKFSLPNEREVHVLSYTYKSRLRHRIAVGVNVGDGDTSDIVVFDDELDDFINSLKRVKSLMVLA